MVRARSFLAFTARSHLSGALAASVGGGIAMWVAALALVREMENFPDGGAAFGAMMATAAEAMRALRWPAERLDTLGGYLTYHNLTLVPLLLGIYAAVQGAQALRGSEEKHVLDLWLATGRSRWAIVADRTAGFAVALAIVALGIGLGTAAGMGLSGDAQLGPSLIVGAEGALAAAVFYALALFLSSVFVTSGAAAGLTVLVMVGLYVATNVWERMGVLGGIRFLSPFWYRSRSDMLIPGREFDPAATAALVAMTVALILIGGAAFARRDFAGTILPRRAAERTRITTPAWRPTIWVASLLDQRFGLLAWAIGSAVFMGVYVSLTPQVEGLFGQMDFYRQFLAPGTGDLVTQLIGFCGEILGPTVAAFAVVQAARWSRERTDGRDEMVLGHPVSRARYVVERLAAVAAGALVVAAGATAGLLIGAAPSGPTLSPAGLARMAADLVLLSLAVGAVSAAVVAALRGTGVLLLTAWLVASYLVALFAPIFEWPDWVPRLSIFQAFGEPYVDVPDLYGIAVLAALALAGAMLAIATLERRRAV